MKKKKMMIRKFKIAMADKKVILKLNDWRIFDKIADQKDRGIY